MSKSVLPPVKGPKSVIKTHDHYANQKGYVQPMQPVKPTDNTKTGAVLTRNIGSKKTV